eukprot:scaffold47997_cov34-Cyclotella_meneghiniana.AAC.1
MKDVSDEFESSEMKPISSDDDNKEPIGNDNDSAVGGSMDKADVDMKTESRSDASEVPIRGDNDTVNAGMTTESSEKKSKARDDMDVDNKSKTGKDVSDEFEGGETKPIA